MQPFGASSIQPRSFGIAGNPAAVRKRAISTSGWTPSSSLRITLRIAPSPMRIEVFDCSALLRLIAKLPTGSAQTESRAGARPRRKPPISSVREPSAAPEPALRSSLIQDRTKPSTEKASTRHVSPSPLPAAGIVPMTPAGSAARAGTRARGAKRRKGRRPCAIAGQIATAAPISASEKGTSAAAATSGLPASLAGYQRCFRRKSGRTRSAIRVTTDQSSDSSLRDRACSAPEAGDDARTVLL
jgi:hypothetical protein